ncbi:unnamed protein product (macronuclear) [Paramecium tetraurelia]|uniref:Uncharacterized protein n=1 Tax=Paramecium tetraurelia TaxID=5888 RepID=A0E823_PARTE|nr:uncharacterized protein GSPATT00024168001 [Paramecium tetraurelia]CAK91440.1 unnamed protein product [Paramecium tetraurelia]|eukprot:XP_001458837.1 hypothetical protein (macronuclear) [Paramecium tetraurelia strain d4-2]
MNQPNHVISENLVISQPLYDNDLAAQSIYDKYLKDCSLMPIRLIEESKETQERPFAGTRQSSQQQQNQRNEQIIQEISSQEREQRNRNQQQIQQANYQQDQQYQNNQMRHPQQNVYYHQRQFNQFQNYHYDQHQYHQHRRNQQNYRMEQEYYGHQMRRQEQGRRRQQQQPKYGLDQNEIAALTGLHVGMMKTRDVVFAFQTLRRMKRSDFCPVYIGCVDSWLASKGSCPLCKKYVRSLVQQFS